MKVIAATGLLSTVLALGAASSAASGVVERSGHTFHMAVCSLSSAPGQARCHAHIVTDSSGKAVPMIHHGRGQFSAAATTGPAPYYLPSQIRAAYNIHSLGAPNTTVAIVDAYAYPGAAADLATFRAEFGLPACTQANRCLTIVNEHGGLQPPKTADAGWDIEQAIDLDTVSTMCPNCRILLVEADTSNLSDLAWAEMTAALYGARVISNSYGGGEQGTQSLELAYNHPGVAVTASAGDYGYGVAFPASSPHVTAVGGTTLNWDGMTRSETAWAGTGSGCSAVYGAPIWQSPTNHNMANNTLCTTRVDNDVSADADPNTGLLFYISIPGYQPGFYVAGGTSVSNQIIAGIYGVNGGVSFQGSSLYSAPPGALNDVVSGNNGACGGTYFCTAGPGYDGPTGLGTPNGARAF